jgi:hypothetical protein
VILVEHPVLLTSTVCDSLFIHKLGTSTTYGWSNARILRLANRPNDQTHASGRRGRIGSRPMKLLYKPVGFVAAIISAKIGQSLFKSLWARIDDAAPPRPRTAGASGGKVVTAAALEAATMAGVAAAVDRATARSFHYLTGIWPGDKPDAEDGHGDRDGD